MRRHGLDVAIGVVLFAAALLVRWPHLMVIPAFGDESLEVQWALEIAQGKRLALTGHDPYYGPLFSYLIAIAFKLFGTRLIVPRATIAVFGALTVPLTFWFGRVVEGRWAGLIAAALVATCPALELYSSHYAWSNSLTPLFATLAFFALYIGVEQHRSWLLAVSGFLVALAVQTHPLTAVPFAGSALWLVSSRRRHGWLTWAEIGKPALLFVVGYSPVLLENVIRPFITMKVAFMRTYAFVPTTSPHDYLWRLLDLGRTFSDMLAGGLRVDNVPASFPAVIVAGVAVILVVALDLTRGNRLFSYSFLAAVVVWPAFVKLYTPRYITFLVPMTGLAIAIAVSRITRRQWSTGWSPVVRLAATALSVIAFVAVPVVSLDAMDRYRTAAVASGLTNDAYDRLLGVLRDQQACGASLVVEDIGFPYADPAWVGLDAADYVLTLSGCEHRQFTAVKLREAMSDLGDGWALLSASTAKAWEGQWHLNPVFVLPAPTGPDLVSVTLFRVTRAGAS